MSSLKNEYPVSWMNVQKLNKRIPKKLERKQDDLAKKFRKPKSEPFDSLTELYEFLDEMASYAHGLVACKKGCSHCCHMEVGLTQLEADYISAFTGFQASKAPADREIKKDGWIDSNRPCPFLKNDACSIYEFRPMVCRTHLVFEKTNEVCNPENNGSFPQIDRMTAYPGAMRAYGELTVRYGGGIGDIREFFSSTTMATYVSRLPEFPATGINNAKLK